MAYKHKFAIKHLPKFVFGAFLVVVCTISVIGGLYVLFFTDDHTAGTLTLTMLNGMGLTLGATIFLPDSIEYKIIEVSDEDLTIADQLKKDLKG